MHIQVMILNPLLVNITYFCEKEQFSQKQFSEKSGIVFKVLQILLMPGLIGGS